MRAARASWRTDRRGIALALVLWVLVVAAALLTIALFVAVQERRASGAERLLHRGFAATEAGLGMALAARSPGELRARIPRPFDSLSFGGGGTGGDSPWQGVVRRLTPGLLLLEVTARAPDSLRGGQSAEVRLGQLVGVRPTAVTVTAALSVGGAAFLGDGASVSGRWTPSEGDPACPDADSVAGLVADSMSLNATVGVDGSPPLLHRSGTDSLLAPLDAQAFAALVPQATITLPGGSVSPNPATVGTACDLREVLNWGAPTDSLSPCSNYVPVVHATGDLQLGGGEGQGILLVDGDLSLGNGYRFYGIILVLGRLTVLPGATPALVVGTVAAGSVGSNVTPARDFSVKFSKCMVSKALLSTGQLVPLWERGWKQLF